MQGLGREGEVKIGEDEGEESGRISKDKKVNGEGEIMMEELEENGWMILNGQTKGDEEREWTYIEAIDKLVIDYVIGDEKVREREELCVGDQVDSDHHPLIMRIGETGTVVEGSRRGRMVRGE